MIAFLSQSNNFEYNFDTDPVTLILDSGALSAFTYSKNDFLTYRKYKGNFKGLGKLSITGKGTASYNITNDNGIKVALLIANVCHVPQMKMRLISPQHIAKQSRDQT